MKTNRKQTVYVCTSLILGISALLLYYRYELYSTVRVQQDARVEGNSSVAKIGGIIDIKLLYTSFNEQLQVMAVESDTIDNVASHRDRGNKRSYVLALDYGGQQGASVRGLGSHQCWVGSFGLPMDVVEPFVPNSTFRSKKESDPVNMLRFSDFFDFDHYNSISEEEGHVKLATWDEFLKTAPRNVVFVYVTPASDGLTWEAPTVNETGATRECYNIYKLSHHQVPQLSYLAKHGFCIVRIVSFLHITWHTKHTPIKKMEHDAIFRGWKPEEVTVVFGQWGVRWYEPNPALQNPDMCKGISAVQLRKKLLPSPQLLKHAKHYEDMFLQPKTSVAIMLRFEHALSAVRKMNKKIDYCFQEATSHALKYTNFSAGKVFITTDIGKYASSSWKKNRKVTNDQNKLRILVTDTLHVLYDDTWTFTEWEESFSQVTDGIEDGGYIAALQRVIASRADCLVLVGGGNFHILALQEYMKTHPDPAKQCIHLICIRQMYKEDFHQIGFVVD